MKNPIQAVYFIPVGKQARMMIELDPQIIKQARLKDFTLFEQELTPNGDILLKRLEENP